MLTSRTGTAVTAILLVLPLTACSDTTDSSNAEASTAARHSVPDDFCERIDFSLAAPVFGDPLPLPPTDRKQASTRECGQAYHGDVRGMVSVWTQVFDEPAKARVAYERWPATGSSATPFPGREQLNAEGIRYAYGFGNATIHLLDGNLMLQVKLTTMRSPEPQLEALLPEVTTRIVVQALELIRQH